MNITRKLLVAFFILCSFVLGIAQEQAEESAIKSSTFAGFKLRNIGPAMSSGRIADIIIDQKTPSIWYVAAGSGGVWKTVNSGTTWTPIFDNYGSYSIGCLAMDPSNHNTLWVGTGENSDGRHVGYGDGVYRSLDGGKSWKNMGLKETEHIGTIIVDPRDSNVIYVAAKGPIWSPGGERGVYKSVDGGVTWELKLSKGEYTGANEIAMDPRNPDLLYAALHQRHRTVAALINGGPESGIYKSEDGGENWRELKRGLPGVDKGKIGLSISPVNPDVVYATVEIADRKGGFYRSADRGESWEKRNDYISGGTGPHYYQEIFASPHAMDRIYQMDPYMQWTEDGGRTFKPVGERWKHVDNHALAFNPHYSDYLLSGCDGGLYESWDLGKTWKYVANLPITQFYKVAVDVDKPFYNIYGGTQDNNTQGGPSRTDNNHGIRNSDWFVTLGGDGYQPATDPVNPDIVYSQLQNGSLVRFDRTTGEALDIQPQPGKGEESERWNWDAPILVSPHNNERLYFGSRRLWKSDDRGDSWTPVSEDLSRGIDRLTMKMMGDRVWSIDAVWDLGAMSQFGNLTSLSESPLVEGLIYAGTDDGLVQVTEDGGDTWRKIDSFPGVPDYSFVNDIKADLHDPDTVYVLFDAHKQGDFKPYLLKSTDRGNTWTAMVGDLPDRHILWRIVQDHERADMFFLGSEYGIHFTLDGGTKWMKLSGIPVIAFRDLAIQKRENDLVGASFGRGFYIFDDYSPLRAVTEELLAKDAHLFDIKKSWWYLPRNVLGGGEKASQGANFYTAPNPPFGSTFTYYLKDSVKTKKQVRQAEEAKVKKEGGDNTYPGWDALKEEAREEAPAIILTVRNAAGEEIRTLTGPASKGFHRITWDLLYAFPAGGTNRYGRSSRMGMMAPPGTYTVSLTKKVGDEITDLGITGEFEVVRLRDGALKGATPEENLAFQKECEDLMLTVNATSEALNEAKGRVDKIRALFGNVPSASADLISEARALQLKAMNLQEALQGERVSWWKGRAREMSITGRLSGAIYGSRYSTYGPTGTHRQSLAIAKEEFSEMYGDIKSFIEFELPAFEQKLDAAGIPWTSSRKLPDMP